MAKDRSARWWRRMGTPGRFRYVDAAGHRITNEAQLDRIRSLRLPPAWRDVRIAPSDRSGLQAIGFDAKGRKQYVYHPRVVAAHAEAKYQKLVDSNPADVEAAGGLAIAKVMQRTQGVDLAQARAAAAENPDDVDAQTMVADLDMLGGHVEDAFTRLVNLVARTADPERSRARDHLLGLFAAVGNDDPRVLAGRRNLASALF